MHMGIHVFSSSVSFSRLSCLGSSVDQELFCCLFAQSAGCQGQTLYRPYTVQISKQPGIPDELQKISYPPLFV